MIYAAEEPVTLAQLSMVFAAEALAERAERLAREQAQFGVTEQGPVLIFEQGPADAETSADEVVDSAASDPGIAPAVEHPEQLAASPPDGFTATAGGVTPAPPGEGQRLSRQREREARDEVRRTIGELIDEYDRGDRGVEIREIAGGYRIATKPEYHDAVRGFVKSLKPVMKLTLQALETLAVIAYKQPVTAPEVSEIRGVDSGGVLGSLISRKLVTTAGRKQVIGRPILYKTTKEFLLRFGLRDLAELPSMEEFEKMAGELVESESESAAQLDLPAAATPIEEGETPVQSIEQDSQETPSFASALEGEPSVAADVPAAPELAEEREEEELLANARAIIKVDDESLNYRDLPGVHRDTAGRVDIDSKHSPSVYDEDEY